VTNRRERITKEETTPIIDTPKNAIIEKILNAFTAFSPDLPKESPAKKVNEIIEMQSVVSEKLITVQTDKNKVRTEKQIDSAYKSADFLLFANEFIIKFFIEASINYAFSIQIMLKFVNITKKQ
jgi:hypothetical protein